MVKVKNLHNTSERLPDGYATWKDYWKAKKGYWPTLCAAYGCNNPAMLGGHVIKIDSAACSCELTLSASCLFLLIAELATLFYFLSKRVKPSN